MFGHGTTVTAIAAEIKIKLRRSQLHKRIFAPKRNLYQNQDLK